MQVEEIEWRGFCSVPKLSLWQRCLRAINRISDISPKTQDISTLLSAGMAGEGWLALRERQNAQRHRIFHWSILVTRFSLVSWSLAVWEGECDQLVVPWQHCITKNNLIVYWCSDKSYLSKYSRAIASCCRNRSIFCFSICGKMTW